MAPLQQRGKKRRRFESDHDYDEGQSEGTESPRLRIDDVLLSAIETNERDDGGEQAQEINGIFNGNDDDGDDDDVEVISQTSGQSQEPSSTGRRNSMKRKQQLLLEPTNLRFLGTATVHSSSSNNNGSEINRAKTRLIGTVNRPTTRSATSKSNNDKNGEETTVDGSSGIKQNGLIDNRASTSSQQLTNGREQVTRIEEKELAPKNLPRTVSEMLEDLMDRAKKTALNEIIVHKKINPEQSSAAATVPANPKTAQKKKQTTTAATKKKQQQQKQPMQHRIVYVNAQRASELCASSNSSTNNSNSPSPASLFPRAAATSTATTRDSSSSMVRRSSTNSTQFSNDATVNSVAHRLTSSKRLPPKDVSGGRLRSITPQTSAQQQQQPQNGPTSSSSPAAGDCEEEEEDIIEVLGPVDPLESVINSVVRQSNSAEWRLASALADQRKAADLAQQQRAEEEYQRRKAARETDPTISRINTAFEELRRQTWAATASIGKTASKVQTRPHTRNASTLGDIVREATIVRTTTTPSVLPSTAAAAIALPSMTAPPSAFPIRCGRDNRGGGNRRRTVGRQQRGGVPQQQQQAQQPAISSGSGNNNDGDAENMSAVYNALALTMAQQQPVDNNNSNSSNYGNGNTISGATFVNQQQLRQLQQQLNMAINSNNDGNEMSANNNNSNNNGNDGNVAHGNDDVQCLDDDEGGEEEETGEEEATPFCKNCASEIPLILKRLDHVDGVLDRLITAVNKELKSSGHQQQSSLSEAAMPPILQREETPSSSYNHSAPTAGQGGHVQAPHQSSPAAAGIDAGCEPDQFFSMLQDLLNSTPAAEQPAAAVATTSGNKSPSHALEEGLSTLDRLLSDITTGGEQQRQTTSRGTTATTNHRYSTNASSSSTSTTMLMSRNRRASAGAMDLDQDCVEIGSNFISQTDEIERAIMVQAPKTFDMRTLSHLNATKKYNQHQIQKALNSLINKAHLVTSQLTNPPIYVKKSMASRAWL